ncbi:MAG: hypothetical protein OJF51_002534 [Nitrospira sp.]|nr:MAG: hypothetical protein OJF51_002534 [Nitrospira sp.]
MLLETRWTCITQERRQEDRIGGTAWVGEFRMRMIDVSSG